MTDWLRKHKFSYKSPKGSPSKTDIEKQREFIEIYEQLKDFAGTKHDGLPDKVEPDTKNEIRNIVKNGQKSTKIEKNQ